MKDVMKNHLGFIALIYGIVIFVVYFVYVVSNLRSMESKHQFQLDSMKITVQRDSIRVGATR